MTDRPIIFNAPMIRALLDGRKTMTRRVVKLPKKTFSGGPIYERPDMGGLEPTTNGGGGTFTIVDGQRVPLPETVGMWHKTTGVAIDAPYQTGDRLWVREAIVHAPMGAGFDTTHWPHGTVAYLADGKGEWFDRAKAAGAKSRPSIHMPRWASRLTLVVEDVRVERLQEISEADAIAEGIKRNHHGNGDQWCDYPLGSSAAGWTDPRDSFESLWRSLHGPDAWAANPWVCAISFRTINANIDTAGAS